ncbi:MAG: LysR family transcriptional regulator [Fretibacterium sp.]|nr:LysR family transcriptional regulator [Fretibacterium sp.]
MMEIKSSTDRPSLRPELRLRLIRERAFFGRGPAHLLSLIEETQSVRHACMKMGMSYSKGWKLIKGAEDALGYPLVERQQGGREGGSSSLTDEARALLKAYRHLESALTEQAEHLFARYFAPFLNPAGPFDSGRA